MRPPHGRAGATFCPDGNDLRGLSERWTERPNATFCPDGIGYSTCERFCRFESPADLAPRPKEYMVGYGVRERFELENTAFNWLTDEAGVPEKRAHDIAHCLADRAHPVIKRKALTHLLNSHVGAEKHPGSCIKCKQVASSHWKRAVPIRQALMMSSASTPQPEEPPDPQTRTSRLPRTRPPPLPHLPYLPHLLPRAVWTQAPPQRAHLRKKSSAPRHRFSPVKCRRLHNWNQRE